MATWSQDNNWTIDKLLDEEKNFNFDPPYQRSDNAWNTAQKDGLINSLMLNYPIPPIYLVDRPDKTSRYIVVDGKQRLKTLISYFKKGSTKKICNIDIGKLQSLKSVRINKSNDSFIFDGNGYAIDENNHVSNIEYNINDFEEPNFYQLRELLISLQNIEQTQENYPVIMFRHRISFVEKLYAKTINTYIGNHCSEDEELTVFRCLNAGSALNIYEHYNGLFAKHKMWAQAKNVAQNINTNDRSKLYAGFLYGQRCEDFKFWADILLTIYHSSNLSNIRIKSWKDNGSDVPEAHLYLDDESIKRVKKISVFMTNNVCDHINKSKRTPKILTALFIKFYYREKAHADCFAFYDDDGKHLENIVNYINNTPLANKSVAAILSAISQ